MSKRNPIGIKKKFELGGTDLKVQEAFVTGATVSTRAEMSDDDLRPITLRLLHAEIDRIDKARAAAGRMSRNAWIRQAIVEKLQQADV